MLHHWIFSYKYCFTESYHANDNMHFFPHFMFIAQFPHSVMLIILFSRKDNMYKCAFV